MNVKWTKSEIDNLKKYYKKTNKDKLLSLFPGKSLISIQSKAHRLKITNRYSSLCNFDSCFFSTPNMINCYWAGFIAADGNVIEKTKRTKVLQIQLHEKDKCILNRFKKDTKCNKKIYTIKNKPHVMFTINSQQWVEDLRKHWNIIPKKTKILQPPNIIDLQLQLAYIIGYIDGDGSICLCKYKNNYNKVYHRLKFMVCGNQDIMEWCSKILHSLEDIKYKPFTIEKATQSDLRYIRCDKLRAQKLITKLLNVKLPWRLPRKWTLIDNLESNQISTRERFNAKPSGESNA